MSDQSVLQFKVTSTSDASALKRFASSLLSVEKSADKTNTSLAKLGAKKVAPTVNDKAIQRAQKEIQRLQDQMAKDLELDVNADTTQAQRRIRQLQSSIKTLQRSKVTPEVNTSGLSRLKSGLSDIGGKLKTFGSGVGDAFKAVGVPILGALGVAAAGAATGIGALAVKSLELADAADKSRNTLKLFLGSFGAADKELRALSQLAAATPFELPELKQSAQRLLGVGMSAKQTNAALLVLGDTASAFGTDLEGVTTVWSQMMSAGKINAEDMNQLVDRGIPAWAELSKAMGVSVADLKDLSSKGKLGKDALEALYQQMGKDYAGQMETQSKTLSGMISTFKDTLTQTLTDVGTALLPIAKALFPSLQKGAEGLGAKVTAALPQIVDAVSGAVTALLRLPGTVLRGLASVSKGFANMVAGVQDSIADLVSGIASAMAGIPGISDKDVQGLRDASDSLHTAADESRKMGGKGFDELTAAAGKADKAVAPMIKKIDEARAKTQASLKLQMDTKAVDDKLTKVDADIKRFQANKANPKLDADKSYWDKKLKEAQADKKRLEQQKIKLKFDANAAPLKQKISSANSQLAALSKKKATPVVNAKIDALKKKKAEAIKDLAALNVKRANPKLDANSAAFKRKVADAEAKLRAADKKKASPDITADDKTGPGVRSAKSNLNSVKDKNVDITTTFKTKGKKAGSQGGGVPEYSMVLPPPVAPTTSRATARAFAAALGQALAAQPAATPQITLHLRDERLADLIDIRVDGRAARAAHVVGRRRGVLL